MKRSASSASALAGPSIQSPFGPTIGYLAGPFVTSTVALLISPLPFVAKCLNAAPILTCSRSRCRTPSEGSKRFVLSESQAIDRGADAVGELATFFLIGVPVVGIYWAESAEKDRAKEAARLEKEVCNCHVTRPSDFVGSVSRYC